MFPVKRLFAPLLLTLLLTLSSCGKETPSPRGDTVKRETTNTSKSSKSKTNKKNSSSTRSNVSPSPKTVKGDKLNSYFPNSSGSYDFTFTQEKKGLAQGKLKKNGKEIAVLSISDVSNNPSAADKFKKSKTKVSGYPMVEQGKNASAILVKNRFQVKVSSSDASFTASDRKTWLGKFDLNGLSQVK